MPGHNHYPDCTCGWCVKYGGYHLSAHESALLEEQKVRHENAERLLSSYQSYSYSSCFVSPNAKCPVCGAIVFFYQNKHGSRVFFDDLGPPWPKHPCTDNRRKSPDNQIFESRPKMRPASAIIEIYPAAIIAKIIPARGQSTSGDWRMFVAVEVGQSDGVQWAKLNTVNPRAFSTKLLKYKSSYRAIDLGDIVYNKRNIFSFFDTWQFKVVIIQNGNNLHSSRSEFDSRRSGSNRGHYGTPPGTFSKPSKNIRKKKR